jgi:hypothetical protein
MSSPEISREFDELRAAIFAVYRLLMTQDRNASRDHLESEQAYRRVVLESIGEILDGHPLTSFSATHLELLELMLAYWREVEVEVGAPEPDPLPRA